MLFAIWRFIQLLLPYGLVLYIYSKNKALPTNIRTSYGKGLKAIMITTEYGILFSEDKYLSNRAEVLKKRKKEIDDMNAELLKELNSMTKEEKERLSEYFKEG